MENNTNNTNVKKSKNSFSKSVKFIIEQAKNGSKVHIAMIVAAILTLIFIIAMVVGVFVKNSSHEEDKNNIVDEEIDEKYDKDLEALDEDELGETILKETEDAGKEYIDNTLFIGDSNTVRTQVYGYTTWDNVVAAMSMGVEHIPKLKMTFFEGMNDGVTVPQAVKIIQPQRIIITYGTNNTVGYGTKNFIKMYKEGLDAIKKAWPYADIIINAVPPIDKQRENMSITMQTIDEYNKALAELAKEEGYKFLNSAEALKDEKTGFAKADYTIGDGIHLNKNGMDALFEYIRTHAYISEDRRPKPLKKVPKRKETPTGIITKDPLAVRGSKIKVLFKSSDESLGKIEGETTQNVKRTLKTSPVKAIALPENGGIFKGWTCSYEGMSAPAEDSITFTVPKVDESVTEIVVTAKFEKASINILKDNKVIKDLSLDNNSSVRLTAEVSKEFRGEKKVSWSSDNTNVVTIDENGNLKAVGSGSANITASLLNGKITSSIYVSVNQSLQGIEIMGENNLKKGATTQLQLLANPDGIKIDMSKVSWSSSDTSVAAVSNSGLVEAIGNGTATITVSYGGITATHSISVTESKPLNGISITGQTSLLEGDKTQLSIVFDPVDTTDSKKAIWSSSDTSVVTVVDGTLFANKEGTAIITCKVGTFTASTTITVKAEVNSVSSITLSNTNISLAVGSSATITATPVLIYPDRPAGVDLTQNWSSANGYVSVSNGVITANAGFTSETGTLSDIVTVTIGGISATCNVTITGVELPQQQDDSSPEVQI